MANGIEIVAPLLIRWLTIYWFHSTLLLAVVWVGRRWVQNPILQEMIWKGALVGGLLTATLHLAIPPWIFTPIVSIRPSPSSPAPAISAEIPIIHTVDTPTSLHGAQPIFPIPLASDAYTLILEVWTITVIIGLIWLGWSYYCLYRRLGKRTLLQEGTLYQQLINLCQHAKTSVPLLSLTEARIPPILLPHGEICLPRSLLQEMPLSEQRGVLAHELAHKQRRDHQWILLCQLMVTIFPFQPLNRLAQRHLQPLAESLSDADALRLLGTPLPLVNSLVRVATWLNTDPLPVVAMAVRPTTLTERVQQLLHPPSFHPLSKIRLYSGVAAISLMLLFMTPPIPIMAWMENTKHTLPEHTKPIPTPSPRATSTSANGASVYATPTPRRSPPIRPTVALPPVMMWPVAGEVTVQPSHYHMAIDIAGEEGTPIVAAWEGTILAAGYQPGGYGYRIIIKHTDGYETLYGHLQTIEVEVGDMVKAGEGIGKRGASGRTTGPTLHFEVRYNGARVNPWNYLP
jgi:beta-lactamase regulating signal transducer with metallopeptidase domain